MSVELGPLFAAVAPVELVFYVPGKAQTAGSPDAIPFRRADGTMGVRTVEGGGNPRRKAAKQSWRTDLRAAAAGAMAEAGLEMWGRDAALELEFVFVRPRPSAHLRVGRRSGELKPWAADLRPVARPDLLKVARAAEDALSAVVYADDSAIVTERLSKVYGDQVGLSVRAEGVMVRVAPASAGPSLPGGSLPAVPDPKGAE